ncbi:hypothetical protein PoB_005710600 [Plakobranchus ocellatus]|uniref:Uncharacterized protein n=1 Tax=Plakobranchus ocellatus TaxID=259542 RepID=A0AAV4CGT9_9GAST|nr:hypothetical protein PoB_005710600 [Plakobranchus ocellatus]
MFPKPATVLNGGHYASSDYITPITSTASPPYEDLPAVPVLSCQHRAASRPSSASSCSSTSSLSWHWRAAPHSPSCSKCYRRQKSRSRLRRLSNILPVSGTVQDALDSLTLPAPAASLSQVRF